jgi:glycine cleavage system H protein
VYAKRGLRRDPRGHGRSRRLTAPMSRTPFRGAVPDGLLYDTTHDMWVKREGADVIIGATVFGIFLAGEIIAFTAKPKGAEVALGRGLGTVECAKTVLAVHAPLSFVLLEANEAAEECPAMLNRDPYDAGWMVRARPTAWEAERGRLVDAAAYRAHVKRIEPTAEFL